MNHSFLLLIAGFVCCVSIVQAQSDVYDSINVGGRWRTFMTHIPKGYNPSRRYPLVLAFHGGSPLGYQSIQFQSRLTQKADAEGFVLVYPEGTRIAGARTYNAGACCAPATTANINDVEFVDVLLNTVFATRSIDTSRVYATGFSNGALLCYRLANELPQRFAAIAPVAGCLVIYPWSPKKAVPIISFHSYQDQNVKYNGGITTGTTGTYFPPQDSMLGVIATGFSCSRLKDTLLHQQSKYDHFIYRDCSCGVVIEQYVSYDGEHSWPGGQSTGNVDVSNQFNATELMWEFFKRYTTTCGTTSSVDESSFPEPRAYPNPFTSRIMLVPTSLNGSHMRLFNSLGIEVWNGKNIEEQDFSELPHGLYVLRVSSPQAVMVVKGR